MSLPRNERLGSCEVLSLLGSGGMGEVYHGRDLKLGRDVAIKVLRGDLTSGPESLRRFEQEARAASALNHPNIVTIYDIGHTDDERMLHYIVMELVAGRTLREVVKSSQPLEVVLGWMRQVAEALAVAHEAGIVHRDIKPENIMVRDDGYVKLVDFGLARLVGRISGETSQTDERTLPGTLLGTARYMSPEQVRAEAVTHATDVFSLGTVLYELGTGHHPFDAEHLIGVLNAICSRAPLVPTRLRPGLPSAFEDLVLQMLHKEAAQRPRASEVERELKRLSTLASAAFVPCPPPPARRRITGRESDIQSLGEALETVSRGCGLLLSVAGEAGMGKTTLIETFLDQIAGLNQLGAIGRGRCSERLAGTEAYLPFLEAFDSLLQSGDRESISGVLRTCAPTWYDEVRPSGRLQGAPPVSQERLKREVGAFLQELSNQRPLVLFFDDFQWADASTVDLLSYVAARFDTMRTLFLVTYRPSELQRSRHPFLQVKLDLQTRGLCREIGLGFLSLGDVRQYLSLEFPRNRFLAEFAAVLHRRTEGNPLFMVALVRHLRDRGVIVEEDGVFTLERAVTQIEKELPDSIRSMIELKIGSMSEEDRKLLIYASVQGYEFDSAVLSRATTRETAEVEERLEELGRLHGLVNVIGEHELPDGTLTLRFRFVHILYQNALYRLLTPTRRAAASRAMADALIAFHGESNASAASNVAFLLEAARDFDRAADFFLLAARHAARVLAYHERAMLAERGLTQLRSRPESAARTARELSLLVVLGPAVMATKGWAAPEVETTYSRARELAERTNDDTTLFQALWGLFSVRLVRAEFEASLELCRALLALAEKRESSTVALQAHLGFGETFFFLGRLAEARVHLEESRRLSPAAVRESKRAVLWQDLGCRGYYVWLSCLLGYPDTALRMSRESIDLVEAREVSHPFSLAYAFWPATLLHQFRNEPSETAKWASEAIELCRDHELSTFWSWGTIIQGWAIAKVGRRTDGLRQMKDALELFRSTGSETASTYFLGLLGETLGDDGQTAQGLRTVEDALALAGELGERFFEAELHRLKGELEIMEGLHTRAEASFRSALRIAREQGAKWFELRAAKSLYRRCRTQEEREEARRPLSELYGSFTEGWDTPDLQEAKRLLEYIS